jgi:hypothetical protein
MGRNHRLRRLAALATCVGSAAVAAAFSIAAPAMAVEKVPCYPTGFASGSSLQGSAQTEDWLTSSTEGWGGTDFEATEKTECTEKPEAGSGPKITYTKTSSGEGLEEFGDNSGVFKPDFDPRALEAGKKSEIPLVADAEPEEGSGKLEASGLDFYVATDDAPTNSQDGEAEAAAEAYNPAQITIPVAQAPIAVMLSLPAGCETEQEREIDLSNATLSELWDGAIVAQGGYAANTWGALLIQLGYTKIAHASEFEESKNQYLETPGAKEKVLRLNGKGETVEVEEEEPGCVQSIKLQADYTESGASYPFKTYLSQIDYTVWNAYADDAENWPSTVKLEDPNTSGSGSKKSESDGGLAENTAANPGSVGYASVGDAAKNGGFTAKATVGQFGTGQVKEGGKEVAAKSLKHEILWAEIQNNGTAPEPETSGYADPLIPGEGHAANCQTSVLVPGDEDFPSSYNDSWYGITATDPSIERDAKVPDYPICALTFDVTWHHFQNPGLFGKHKAIEEVANTVHNLMEYITTQGQLVFQGHYYQRVPTSMAAHIALAVKEIKY